MRSIEENGIHRVYDEKSIPGHLYYSKDRVSHLPYEITNVAQVGLPGIIGKKTGIVLIKLENEPGNDWLMFDLLSVEAAERAIDTLKTLPYESAVQYLVNIAVAARQLAG